MRIRLADDADQSSWDAFVLRHPQGLAYQLYAWKTAVEQAYGFRGLYLLAEEQGVVCGVLPLIHFKASLLGGGRFVSLPYCDAGGVLADNQAISNGLVVSAEVLTKEKHAKGLELRQSRPLNGTSLRNHAQQTEKVRMVLDLHGDADQLLAGLKAKLRSQVKKPLRDGLSVRFGGAELVDEFYQIFAENMRDLGSPVHSRRWIRAVVVHFGERARIGVVYSPEGLPVASGVILLHPKTISVPWASSLRRFNHLNPNVLLYWSFLAFAADGGFTRFDFGRSTPGEGTYRFKEQWGAEPIPLYWEDRLQSNGKKASVFLEGARRRSAEAIWSRLPLSATIALGPVLRRHISL
jgi:FemAB-related protein (PEP-CTERM system-associated)